MNVNELFLIVTPELLVGRSSMTMQGIFVPPRVIDADFEREIKVMTHSHNGISVVK